MTNLLIYRFALFNLVNLLGVGWLVLNTSALNMLTGDRTFIVALIVLLFIAGFVGVTREVIVATRMRNGTVFISSMARDKDLEKVAWLGDVTEWLVSLGLIGTVVGFSIALAGVAESALGTVEGTRATVTHLMAGMKIALDTTIVGSVTALWHSMNVRMLRTALVSYWSDKLEGA